FSKSRILKIVHLVDASPGQRGTVILRNGQRTQGLILTDGFKQVVVEVEGIPITFKRSAVDEVRLDPTIDEQYAQFKATLDPAHAGRHLTLCQWLIRVRRYELAREELKALIKRHPTVDEGRRLLLIVDAQIAMQDESLEEPRTIASPTPSGSGLVNTRDVLPREIISREDANLIRVYEIDFDAPPKVSVEPDTIRTMLETYGSSKLLPHTTSGRTALFRAEPIEIVRLLFALRARDLYPEIQVIGEPHALNTFRRRVHNTWLMNSCATSRCHGGIDGGRFFLHNRNFKDQKVWLTNLLILERLDLDPAWPLVNYDSPMDSLIIQYGLPRENARKPHPDVRGWTPVFRKGNHRMLESTLAWMNGMMQPRPLYPVDYEPPMIGTDPRENGQRAPGEQTGGRQDR
ncbi:MAG: hypothetical protein ACYTF9_09595, partial [Planctomycetota bacterium]